LLEAILDGTPALRGALCAGFPEQFDAPGDEDAEDRRARLAVAVSCCRCCPALQECRAWVDGLPRRRRPVGIVAGQVRRTYDRREDSCEVSARAPAAV
jgi:WhiB family transcriptional regulator, redox-sensing transcriptional regulator